MSINTTKVQTAITTLLSAINDVLAQAGNPPLPSPSPTPTPTPTPLPGILPWAASPPNTTIPSPSGIQIGVSATTLTLTPNRNDVYLTAVASKGQGSAGEVVFISGNPNLFTILSQDPIAGSAVLATGKATGKGNVLVQNGDATAAIAITVALPYVPPKPTPVA
jgi:hypothetical protein